MASKKRADTAKKASKPAAKKSKAKPKAKKPSRAPSKAAKPVKAKPAPKPKAKPKATPKKPSKATVKPSKATAKKPTRKPVAKRKPAPKKPAPKPQKKPSGLPANLASVLKELEEASKGKRSLDDLPSLDKMLGRPRDEPLIVSDDKPKPSPKEEEREAGDESGDYLAAMGWTVYNLTDGFDASMGFSVDDRAPHLPRFGVVPGLFWRAEIHFKADSEEIRASYQEAGLDFDDSDSSGSNGDSGNGGTGGGTERFIAKTAWHSDTTILEETIDIIIEEATDRGWEADLCEVIAYFRFDHIKPQRVKLCTVYLSRQGWKTESSPLCLWPSQTTLERLP